MVGGFVVSFDSEPGVVEGAAVSVGSAPRVAEFVVVVAVVAVVVVVVGVAFAVAVAVAFAVAVGPAPHAAGANIIRARRDIRRRGIGSETPEWSAGRVFIMGNPWDVSGMESGV